MASYVIEPIDSHTLWLGEGPHWDAEKKLLYYVDIKRGTVYSYDPECKEVSKAVVGNGEKPVTLIVPVANEADKFVIGYGADIATIKWDGVNEVTDLKIIATTPDPNAELKMNDGKCSPGGILFAGTMETNFTLGKSTPGKGAFYSFKTWKAKMLLDNITISNGLAWSLDEKKLYFIDSFLYRVDCFDCDAETAELSNRKTVFDFKANQISAGLPDGMTIDVDGNLWVAVYEGSCILHINPTTGKLLNTIKMPTAEITSVAFGGPHLDELYVTSAAVSDTAGKDPLAGCTFRVTGLKTRGFAGSCARM